MKNKPNVIAMIPARIGSTRLKMKNLALLNGKPLIYYAIQSAKKSKAFNKIFINSENNIFADIAKRYGVSFYQRSVELGSSNAKSDFVVYDFIKNNPCDIIVWVNSIAPLQTAEEIKKIVDYFIKNNIDTLITVKNEQVHAVYKNKPVNFNINEEFAKTQDLEPVKTFVYSIMMWKTSIFVKMFQKNKFAFFCGKTEFFPCEKLSSIIIKKQEDLMLAEYILKTARKSNGEYKIKYDRIVNNIKGAK